jgi:hypothetical protein
MLQISKFKLIDQGRGGIEIEGRESMVMQGGYAVIDKIKRERRLMLAPDVIAKIQELNIFSSISRLTGFRRLTSITMCRIIVSLRLNLMRTER